MTKLKTTSVHVFTEYEKIDATTGQWKSMRQPVDTFSMDRPDRELPVLAEKVWQRAKSQEASMSVRADYRNVQIKVRPWPGEAGFLVTTVDDLIHVANTSFVEVPDSIEDDDRVYVMTGNLEDGFQMIGPFDDPGTASNWCDSHLSDWELWSPTDPTAWLLRQSVPSDV